MTRQVIRLIGDVQREYARRQITAAPAEWVVTIQDPTRTTDQNAKLWPMLGDVSRQVAWYGRKLSDEDWKHVFTASLSKLDVVPNLDGTGFVALGQSTSKMGKRAFSDLIELVTAFGAQRGVVWSDPMEWREK